MRRAPGATALLVSGLALLVFGPINVMAALGTVNYGIRWQNHLLFASSILFLAGGAFEFFVGLLGATFGKEIGKGLPLMILGALTLIMTLAGGVSFFLAKSLLTQEGGTFVMAGISVVLLAAFIVSANLNRIANKAILEPQ
ncbi:MAG: hypothetical protein FWF45_07910 [Coriobacteriia bacterium]|nr:hypothetical protein [Coriobacteriia bacterium]